MALGLVNWNVEWATPRSRRSAEILMRIGSHDLEIVYLTETASNNQLDYVFASRGFHEGITVRAMNSVEEWGTSDHCRLLIKIADGHTPALDS